MGLNPGYADDDNVNGLLDKLIANARLESNVVDADPINSQQDVMFDASNVFEGLDAVNNILTRTGFSSPLPALSDDSSNAKTVLAAAISTLIRLSRANAANIKLRQQAETFSRDTCNRLEQLQNELSSTRQKTEALAASAARAQQQAAAAMQALGESERRHGQEVLVLRGNIQKCSAKERQLLKEAKRREGESAKLRNRVNELIKTSNSNKPLMPRVTFAPTSSSTRTRIPVTDKDNARSVAMQNAEQARNALQEIFATENDTFRNILRVVQEDMDELLCLCDYSVSRGIGYKKNPSIICSTDVLEAGQNLESSTTGGEGAEEVTDKTNGSGLEEGSCWEQVLATDDIIGAPTEDQMRLPFELIREEYEDSLEQKFRVVRDALNLLQQQSSAS